jgi:hypothetical protein
MNAPDRVVIVVTRTTNSHLSPPIALIKCGDAAPSVMDPTSAPMASPRPLLNQVEINFNDGGYTSARNTPVIRRKKIARYALYTSNNPRLAAAAPMDPQIMSFLLEITSERLTMLEPIAPITKPS